MTEQNYKDMFPLKKMEFEKKMFNVPNNTCFYLCKLYRDIHIPGKFKNSKYILNENIDMGFNHEKKENLWKGDLYVENEKIKQKD